MRSNYIFLPILAFLLVVWLIVNMFAIPLAEVTAEALGRKNTGRAVIPSHLDESQIREKARLANEPPSYRASPFSNPK